MCGGPTYLVDNSSGAETFHVFGACLDDGTDRVEDNGNNNKFNSAKDIGNFCCGRLHKQIFSFANSGLEACGIYLSGGSNDSAENVDGCEKTVLTIALGSIGLLWTLVSISVTHPPIFWETDLVCVPNGSIQPVNVGDEEHTRKQADAIKETKVRVDDFNTVDSRAAFTQQLNILSWRSLSMGVLSRVFPEAAADRALRNSHDEQCQEMFKRLERSAR